MRRTAARTQPMPLPAPQYSDVELGVRFDDIRTAAEAILPPALWRGIRIAARTAAIARNQAESKRGDCSGNCATHRPLNL